MKIFTLKATLAGLLISTQIHAQKSPENLNSADIQKISIHIGGGIAAYNGDLMEKDINLFSQPGYSVNLGVSFPFLEKLSARFDVGVQKLQAADSKNSNAGLKARNLSFKSTVFDASISAEYSFLSLKRFPATPYISAGLGFITYDPYTTDASGNKQYLRELATEGQGLAAYPDRKIYKRTAVQFPLGVGVKYPIGDKIKLQLEVNYHFTGTDYLDDVSTDRYPDKALLDARNPLTSKFTYRGNEVGAGAYPTGSGLRRGNPNNNDGFITSQLKVSYSF